MIAPAKTRRYVYGLAWLSALLSIAAHATASGPTTAQYRAAEAESISSDTAAPAAVPIEPARQYVPVSSARPDNSGGSFSGAGCAAASSPRWLPASQSGLLLQRGRRTCGGVPLYDLLHVYRL